MRQTVSGALAVVMTVGIVGFAVVANTDDASAATITVTAPQAQMSGHMGTNASGTSDSPQNDDRYRYGSASTSTGSGKISNPGGSAGTGFNGTVWAQAPYRADGTTAWVSNGTTAWTAHGYSDGPNPTDLRLDLSEQSALGFEPSKVTTVETGRYFNLGRMVHSNNPIHTDSQYFKGNLNIRFQGQDMSYPWLMNETPNTGTPSNPANNDVTTFTSQVGDKTFVIGGVTYTLVVQGFTASGDNNRCEANPTTITPKNEFSTVEGTKTYGCLYASIEQVRDVTVKKVVDAPYGAAPAGQTFGFTSTSTLSGSPWTQPGTASLKDGESFTRSYNSGEQITVAEQQQNAPWALSKVQCVDANNKPVGSVSGSQVTIPKNTTTDDPAAAKITCTYTNSYTPKATLSLKKNVISNGQPAPVAQPADWTLKAQGQGVVGSQSVNGNGNSAAVTNQSVIAGQYQLSEAANNAERTAGYQQEGLWACLRADGQPVAVDSGKVTLTNGQNVTCTVTNKYQVGSFSVTKNVPAGSAVDAGMKFSGQYTCSGPQPGATRTGTWGPIAAGERWTSDSNVPLGASCAVRTEDRPEWPNSADHSYQWDGNADLGRAVTVAPDLQTITVTNRTTQVLGAVTWKKTAHGSNELLAGATWTLSGPNVPAGTVVTDCESGPCVPGAYNDHDADAGEFLLDGLPWGDYKLVEKTAPAGYLISNKEYTFTIGADHPGAVTPVELGPIENVSVAPPVLPLTGGVGRDLFTALGLLIAALGLVAVAFARIRSQRRKA